MKETAENPVALLLDAYLIHFRVIFAVPFHPLQYRPSPGGGAKGELRNVLFFLMLVSRYSAVSVSQQHIYCELPTQSRTCKNMQSLFLLSAIIWFADAELKARKGKSRPR